MSDATRLPTQNPSALPAGTRLGEFELLSLLGVGGFGIVYLAFDHALEREVAIKEYMPSSLAGRSETMHVSIRSKSDAETFALGLRSFVNEARLLARFDHPSLLKVHRFWEGNGTAYMAMPVMRGRTVKEVRLEMPSPPSEAWMRALLEPLLGAIERLHSEGVYHRDIAPDNIQIEPDGHPVLLDFGAARRVISDKSQALTAILKPAYAPIEQYAEVGAVKQGPWTDIYALGATLHFLLLKRPPPPATARAIHDDVSALTTMALPDCSEDFLHVIDWMLAPRPADRPQSVAALRDVLEGRVPTPVRYVPAQDIASDWDRTVVRPAGGSTVAATRALPRDEDATVLMPSTVRPATVRSPAVPQAAMRPATAPQMAAPPVAASPSAGPAAGGRSKVMLIAAGVVVLAAAAAAVALWPRQPAVPARDLAVAPAPAPATPVAVAPVAVKPAESTVATVVVPTPTPTPTVTAPPAGVAPTPSKAAPKAEVAASPKTVPPPKPVAPRVGSVATTAPSPAPAAASVTAPPPEPPKQKAEVAAPAVQAPAPAPAPEPPKVVPAGPEARCAGRNPLLYFVCMEKECLTSDHAECKKWHKNARHD